MAGLDHGRLDVRRVAGIAVTLLLAGAGSSLVACSALRAALIARQAVRAAPIHPFGAAAGLLALPLGAACWLFAHRRLDNLTDRRFEAWSLREL
jgi:hypothetical protein